MLHFHHSDANCPGSTEWVDEAVARKKKCQSVILKWEYWKKILINFNKPAIVLTHTLGERASPITHRVALQKAFIMFPGRQDLNFWCCFMCIQSINWPPQFAEVIRGKHQKPITVSWTLNQTDVSLKRYGHKKLTGEVLRGLKKAGYFFHPSLLLWSTFFFTL